MFARFQCGRKNYPWKFRAWLGPASRLVWGAKEGAVFRQHARSRWKWRGLLASSPLGRNTEGWRKREVRMPMNRPMRSRQKQQSIISQTCGIRLQKNLLIHKLTLDVKCSRCRLKINALRTDTRQWMNSRFVVPPRALRKMFWGFATFAGKFQQTLVLISTQRPDLPLNRDNSPPTAMTFAEQEARLNPDLTQIH